MCSHTPRGWKLGPTLGVWLEHKALLLPGSLTWQYSQ